jgi:hypothetical protein
LISGTRKSALWLIWHKFAKLIKICVASRY